MTLRPDRQLNASRSPSRGWCVSCRSLEGSYLDPVTLWSNILTQAPPWSWKRSPGKHLHPSGHGSEGFNPLTAPCCLGQSTSRGSGVKVLQAYIQCEQHFDGLGSLLDLRIWNTFHNKVPNEKAYLWQGWVTQLGGICPYLNINFWLKRVTNERLLRMNFFYVYK